MEMKKITEAEENEIYLVISKALQALCQEKPNDAIDFLSKKMLEIIGDDPKWTNQKKKPTTTKNVKINDDLIISNEKLYTRGFIKNFSDLYKIRKQICLGPKGQTYLVVDLQRNHEMRTAKMMKKLPGINSLTLTELKVVRLLNLDHPNIGVIYDILEDEKFVYMIQDYFEHGDLFNFLLKYKNANERLTKLIIKQVISAVKYLHQNDVCHRDIKPQNIFVIKYDPKDLKETIVKLCDFGSSTYFKNCVPLTEFPGNPFYSAPEVINGQYNHKVDIWSVGIIAYLLLTGFNPYTGKEYDVLFKILNEDINFEEIKDEKAKSFIKRLLEKNPDLRPEAAELLEDEWMMQEGDNDYIKDEFGIEVFSKMSKFILGDSLRRSVYTYIIFKKLFNEKNSNLLKLFRECDLNNDGRIDAEELLLTYGKYFPGVPEDHMDRIKEFIDKVDINKSGYIEYSEFLMINNLINNDINKNMLKEVFDFFDVTKNGTIQVDDLKEIFEDIDIEEEKIQEMLKEFDQNSDQEITFAEFYEILTSRLEDKIDSKKNDENQ